MTTHENDISGLIDVNEIYDNSLTKKWIKLISNDKTVIFIFEFLHLFSFKTPILYENS